MVYLIVGSPCSGKTTYIKDHMTNGDIICDVDLLYEAVSNREGHDADLHVHEVALQMKEMLLDIIRDRRGGWKDAYVTCTANTKDNVQKAMDRIRADEAILIDTPYEVCLERAKDRPEYFIWLIQEWHEMRNL